MCLSWHIQNCNFFFYHRNIPCEKTPTTWKKMHVSRSRRLQLFSGDNFSALGRDSCICQWPFFQFKPKEMNCTHNTRMGLIFVSYLLFAPISNFLSKDCKIRIYNAFTLLNSRYCSIVCHFCSGQPVHKGKEIQNRALRVVLNDYQMLYQDLLNVDYHPTVFMGPVWKPLLLKCLNSGITSIPQPKDHSLVAIFAIMGRMGCLPFCFFILAMRRWHSELFSVAFVIHSGM